MRSKQIKAIHIGFAAVIIILYVLASTQYAYAALTFDSQAKNVPVDHQSVDSSDGSFFSSGKLLIKLKSSSRDLIKNSLRPDDTGIDSLNNLNKKHGVSKFEKVAKQGIKSKRDSPLFNWYIVSLGVTEKTITRKSSEFNKLKNIRKS